MAEQSERTPTVVVHDLSITYKVLGGDRRGTPEDKEGAGPLRRLLRKEGTERIREVHAVKGVSFVARHGESIGVVGHNGSGKSTLLRAVAGLIPPSKGRLWVSGEPALLGVNAVLINKLSGKRNIYVGGQALGLSKAEIDAKFDDIVEFSGIGDAVYLPMSTYSSGMGARLRFAISTAATPDVLMIDEALATGDAAFRQRSAKRIAEIRRAAGTVFLVSHSNSTVRQICDRVLWMNRGRLIMDGPTEEVMQAYEATLPKKPKPAKKVPVAESEVPGTRRWSGENRIQIARSAGRETWEPGVEGCFVVSVNAVATARMVTPIAARAGWPILWMNANGLPPSSLAELDRLAPRRVVVVSGEREAPSDLDHQIGQVVSTTGEHLESRDLGGTAADLLEAFPPADTSVIYVTRAANAPRETVLSLVAARQERAHVAIGGSRVDARLLETLSRLAPERLALAGHPEEWPASVVEALQQSTGAELSYLTDPGPMALAAGLWGDVAPGGRVIVSAPNVVELLTATTVSAVTGTPVVVTDATLPRVVIESLRSLQPSEIVVCGLVSALPPTVRAELGELVSRPAV
ncbi:hypothetical protein GCM10022199_09210 [Marihabitans asiaticum]|uniref:ABC-type polysaccharide/polyol phosphate transport system ATPase subunit n=1 Tax=Marihabitans asiaticum TaxID=415218 RepID=A0A560WH06_9MICO|nr:ABC-type polysaccharide/polyol phosphate transport system ATPase subunit [Marihabitans asiaticum]